MLTYHTARCAIAMKKPVPAIAFVGRSGSGKTTLIEKLTDYFSSRGLHVGVIKHMRHEFDIDNPGKDTYRIRKAGAKVVSITNDSCIAIIADNPGELTPDKAAEALFGFCDIIIIEGDKESEYQKIEVIGEPKEPPLHQSGIKNIIALACDMKIDTELPLFSRNDIEGIAGFIQKTIGLSP